MLIHERTKRRAHLLMQAYAIFLDLGTKILNGIISNPMSKKKNESTAVSQHPGQSP